MPASDSTNESGHPHRASPYSRPLLLLLATIAGVSVANIYYNQPLLDRFRETFPEGASWVGAVPASTQLGYAAGMFLLAPLGDRFDRKRLILLQTLGLALALTAAAAAPSLGVLAAMSLAIGILSTIAQQAVPFAAELAPPAERGHAVGTVMSGLLLGILLARTAAGFVAQYFGWRTVFAASVAALLALAVTAAATGLATWMLGDAWEDVHEVLAYLMLALVGVHVAAVVVSGWLHRENLAAAMVTGRKRGARADGIPRGLRLPGVLLLAAVLGFWGWQLTHPAGGLGAIATAESRGDHGDHGDDGDD